MVTNLNNLLSELLTKASSNWNMDEEAIQDAMSKIAFHESKFGTDDYTPVQVSDKAESGYGPGRGLYQYEVDVDGEQGGAHTAINRLINFNKELDNPYDISFLDSIIEDKSYDFSQLTPEQQNMLFLADKLEDETANMGKFDLDGDRMLSNEELAGFHADEHWAGHGGDEAVRSAFIDKLILDYPYYNKP